jgi:hypothetical protein
VEKLRSWSDCGGDVESVFPRDDLLTWVTAYWVTGTIGSSFSPYVEAKTRVDRVEVPTAVTLFPHDLVPAPRAFAERFFDLRVWNEQPDGGHFGAWERPEAFADGLREALALQGTYSGAEARTIVAHAAARRGDPHGEWQWVSQQHSRPAGIVPDQHRGDEPLHQRNAEAAAVGPADRYLPRPTVHDLDAQGARLGPEGQLDDAVRRTWGVGVVDRVGGRLVDRDDDGVLGVVGQIQLA